LTSWPRVTTRCRQWHCHGLEAINSLGVTGFANPELGTVTASENPGNGNGIIEAGEGGKLVIQLKNNSGVLNATAISAT